MCSEKGAEIFFLIIQQNKGKAFEKTLRETLAMKCGVFTLSSVYLSVV